MKFKLIYSSILSLVLTAGFYLQAAGSCLCDNENVSNTNCASTIIEVVVNAGTPNGGIANDAIFTWHFTSGGQAALCGQFANGDYWVAPASGQNSVTLISVTGSDSISVDADPNMESIGLLSGQNNYGNYNKEEDLSNFLPMTFDKTTSLVAAIQRNESSSGKCGTQAIIGECADAYNIVTVLTTEPPNSGSDMLRPNITGQYKEILFLTDFDFSRLPQKPYLAGTDSEGYESIRQRWAHSTEIFGLYSLDKNTMFSEGGRAFRAHILIDDYGAGVAVAWYNDLMRIFSGQNSLVEKRKALSSMLSYGLDLYHAVYNAPNNATRFWAAGATQSAGKFMPPVFFASLAKNTKYAQDLKNVSKQIRDHAMQGPLELAQINDGVYHPVWGDNPLYSAIQKHGAYWGSLHNSQCYDGAMGICNITLGKKTQADPYGYIDGPPNKPGSNYMGSSLGVQRAMVGAMFMMPEICEIINYDPLIQYVDRVHNYGVKTIDDPCVTPDSREDPTTCDPYRNQNCVYYGVTWGPVEPTDPNSPCITSPTPPYTKIGRFTQLDGGKINPTYTCGQIEANWDKIRGSAPSCRPSSNLSSLPAPKNLGLVR